MIWCIYNSQNTIKFQRKKIKKQIVNSTRLCDCCSIGCCRCAVARLVFVPVARIWSFLGVVLRSENQLIFVSKVIDRIGRNWQNLTLVRIYISPLSLSLKSSNALFSFLFRHRATAHEKEMNVRRFHFSCTVSEFITLLERTERAIHCLFLWISSQCWIATDERERERKDKVLILLPFSYAIINSRRLRICVIIVSKRKVVDQEKLK